MGNLSKFGKGENGFNTEGEEEMNDFSPLAPGDYVCAIKKSEMKKNKAGTGSFLSLQFEVKEGESKGRMIFTNLNLDHPNSDTVAMARKELTSLIKGCGLVAIDDSEELHGIEMTCRVVKTAATTNFPAGNAIKGYEPLDGVSKPASKAKAASGDDSAKPKAKPKVKFS